MHFLLICPCFAQCTSYWNRHRYHSNLCHMSILQPKYQGHIFEIQISLCPQCPNWGDMNFKGASLTPVGRWASTELASLFTRLCCPCQICSHLHHHQNPYSRNDPDHHHRHFSYGAPLGEPLTSYTPEVAEASNLQVTRENHEEWENISSSLLWTLWYPSTSAVTIAVFYATFVTQFLGPLCLWQCLFWKTMSYH